MALRGPLSDGTWVSKSGRSSTVRASTLRHHKRDVPLPCTLDKFGVELRVDPFCCCRNCRDVRQGKFSYILQVTPGRDIFRRYLFIFHLFVQLSILGSRNFSALRHPDYSVGSFRAAALDTEVAWPALGIGNRVSSISRRLSDRHQGRVPYFSLMIALEMNYPLRWN